MNTIVSTTKPSEVIQQHLANGVETLRAKFDSRKEKWGIVKSTRSGGWRSYGSGAIYNSKADCEKTISKTADAYPSTYRVDDGSSTYVKAGK